MTDPEKKQAAGSMMGIGLALGVAIGVSLGTALDNLALGIGIGLSLGVALGVALGAGGQKKDKCVGSGWWPVVNDLWTVDCQSA